MACYDFKLTFQYTGALQWEVQVWRREVLVYRERGAWECILRRNHATLEGHLAPEEGLRQVLRSLAA